MNNNNLVALALVAIAAILLIDLIHTW